MVIKIGGHRARFDVTLSTKYGFQGSFGKNRERPNTRQKGDIFSMM